MGEFRSAEGGSGSGEEGKKTPNAERRTPNVQLKAPEFHVGETVYSAVSQDDRGMVVGIEITPLGYIYKVSWAEKIEEAANHYAIELSREPLFTTPTR